MRCSQNLPLQAFKPLDLAKWEKFNERGSNHMENVESQARPQTAIRHPKLAMVSMLLGAFVGMSPAKRPP